MNEGMNQRMHHTIRCMKIYSQSQFFINPIKPRHFGTDSPISQPATRFIPVIGHSYVSRSMRSSIKGGWPKWSSVKKRTCSLLNQIMLWNSNYSMQGQHQSTKLRNHIVTRYVVETNDSFPSWFAPWISKMYFSLKYIKVHSHPSLGLNPANRPGRVEMQLVKWDDRFTSAQWLSQGPSSISNKLCQSLQDRIQIILTWHAAWRSTVFRGGLAPGSCGMIAVANLKSKCFPSLRSSASLV